MNSLTDSKETTCLASRNYTISSSQITLSTVELSLSLCFRAYEIGLSCCHLYYASKQRLYFIKTKHLSFFGALTKLRRATTRFVMSVRLILAINQLTYLLTYLLAPWYRVLLEKLTGLQLVKKFPAFYGTRRFITALTSVRHPSLFWACPIQSTYPHPTSWRSILISPTHLRLGHPSGLFPSGFPTKTLYAPLSSPIRATCPTHLILLDFITRTILGEEYRSFSSSSCNLLHSPVSSSLLGPKLYIIQFKIHLSLLSKILTKNKVCKYLVLLKRMS